ncbi:magnesium-chelatase subunit ChlD, chloroplastic-like [Syzygium oleosum]|uniref:magnesium-chelatase subunit ChlD, chloroplastic-like n=1 Tax=Syzygium oleosum TaxID=219896 RepID=UPI0024B9B045|nr:magnesium-chelatase subunit ChlD, chloroplastic-like [Syzygium oleosum]XP_056170025.1 magnesium-chelatase subunit ChlD, chloroplastic-like [Syzygium oleosum]
MSFQDRVAAVDIVTKFQERANEVFKMEEETDYAKTQIILAREYLKDVTISREQLKYLVMEALRGGCHLSGRVGDIIRLQGRGLILPCL